MLIPCGKRIVVLTEEKDETTAGGIIIPKAAQNKNELIPAKVLAVGPEVEQIKVDDIILIDEYVGKPVGFGGTELLIIGSERVYCIVPE